MLREVSCISADKAPLYVGMWRGGGGDNMHSFFFLHIVLFSQGASIRIYFSLQETGRWGGKIMANITVLVTYSHRLHSGLFSLTTVPSLFLWLVIYISFKICHSSPNWQIFS